MITTLLKLSSSPCQQVFSPHHWEVYSCNYDLKMRSCANSKSVTCNHADSQLGNWNLSLTFFFLPFFTGETIMRRVNRCGMWLWLFYGMFKKAFMFLKATFIVVIVLQCKLCMLVCFHRLSFNEWFISSLSFNILKKSNV